MSAEGFLSFASPVRRVPAWPSVLQETTGGRSGGSEEEEVVGDDDDATTPPSPPPRRAPTNRSTELFITLRDGGGRRQQGEEELEDDPLEGFTPLGAVLGGGMDTVRAFYEGYGEMRDACALHDFEPCLGPNNSEVYGGGNIRLDQSHPLLTQIYSMTVVVNEAPDETMWRGSSSMTPGAPFSLDGTDIVGVLFGLVAIATVAACGAWAHASFCAKREAKGKYASFPVDDHDDDGELGGSEMTSEEGVLTSKEESLGVGGSGDAENNADGGVNTCAPAGGVKEVEMV